ncbi:hypothetical protein [uncultured Stenotrophomonas sp.]|uniref:hypothetical protein n=1 Tax=uncultured Stenotrophomonas sp. TaxID=165438 RepID=UPI0025F8C02F|nr:hypothetical protein [uncultured Stenotrophomonas sp.]
MSTAGSIVVDLLMRTGSFVTDAERAEKAVKKLEKAALAMGTAVGAGLVTAATTLTAMVKSSINSMDEMSKSAARAGMSTEAFSALAYGAGLADVQISDLEASMGRLNKASAAALDPSTKQAKVFDALSISVKDASGRLRPAIDLLYDFADAFAEQQGRPEIVAAGMQVFGKSFQTLIPLIKDGSQSMRDAGIEARTFGQIISSEAGANAEEFNDNLARMKMWVQGVGNAVAANLLPDLLRLSDQFLDSAKNGDKLNEVAQKIADGLRVLASAAGYVAAAFDITGSAIATLMAQGEAAIRFLSGDFSGAKDLYTTASQGFDEKVDSYFGKDEATKPKVAFIDPSEGLAEWKAQKAQEKRLLDMFSGSAGGKSKGAGRGKSDSEKDAAKLQSAYASLNEKLSEQIALHGKNGEAAKLEYELTLGSMKSLSDAQKQELRDKQAKLELMDLQAEADKAARELFQKEQGAEEDRKKAFKDLKSDLEFELSLLTLSNKERAKAIELRYAGIDAASAEGQAIGALSDRLHDQTELTDKLISLQDGMRDAFADNFYDVVSGANSAKDAVKDFFDSVAQNVLKMITQNLAGALFGQQGQSGGGMFGGAISSMFSGMFGGGGSGGASGGGFFSTLTSGFASLFGGSRAAGGDVLSGRGYWVGEEGPEWFEPRGTGTIVPTSVAAASVGGGRPFVQNLNVTVAGKPDRRTPTQIAREAGRESSKAMARNGR